MWVSNSKGIVRQGKSDGNGCSAKKAVLRYGPSATASRSIRTLR